MTVDRLRELAQDELGPGLRLATPERVRAFLDRLQLEMTERPPGGRWVVDGPATSCEDVMRSFFWRALNGPTEDALIHLWILGAEAYLAIDKTPADEEE